MMYMVVSGILVCLYEIFICFVRLCICALYVFPLSSIVKRFEFLKALYKFPIMIIIRLYIYCQLYIQSTHR